MSKKIVAGNWKMNLLLSEAKELFAQLSDQYDLWSLSSEKQVILAAPSIYLDALVQLAEDYPYIYIAAQNCHWDNKGAFTGEISAEMLASIGVSHVIIGHSERRQYFAETNELLAKKVQQTLEHNLSPIFCCGESLEVREQGHYISFILQQLDESLGGLSSKDAEQLIIAYEPIWAIGTGKTATPEQAQEVHAAIRVWAKEKFGANTTIPLLYGGSCGPNNASSLFEQKDIDGGLIGGASLKAETFIPIIKAIQ